MTRRADPDRIVAAVRRHGSDAADLRDAAHEACHALDAGLRRPWTRDAIHEALVACLDGSPAEMFAAEIKARAVECRMVTDAGQYYAAEHWASVCLWESTKTLCASIPITIDKLAESIILRSRDVDVRAMARRIAKLR